MGPHQALSLPSPKGVNMEPGHSVSCRPERIKPLSLFPTDSFKHVRLPAGCCTLSQQKRAAQLRAVPFQAGSGCEPRQTSLMSLRARLPAPTALLLKQLSSRQLERASFQAPTAATRGLFVAWGGGRQEPCSTRRARAFLYLLRGTSRGAVSAEDCLLGSVFAPGCFPSRLYLLGSQVALLSPRLFVQVPRNLHDVFQKKLSSSVFWTAWR